MGKKMLGSGEHLCVCVCVCVCERAWDWNGALLIWKNRDFLFVLKETEKEEKRR